MSATDGVFLVMRALCQCAIGLALLWMATSASPASTDDFSSRLAELQVLQLVSPLEESQRMLDDLLAEVDQAPWEEQVELRMIEARMIAIRGDYPASMALINQLLDQVGSADQRLRLLRLKANIGFMAGYFEEAFDALNQALTELESMNNVEEQARLLTLASQFYNMAGRPDTALRYSNLALELTDRGTSSRAVCGGWVRQAEALAKIEHPRLGLDLLSEKMAVCLESEDAAMIGWAYNALGELALQAGDFTSLQWIVEQAEHWVSERFLDSFLMTRYLRARLNAHAGQVDIAIAELNDIAVELEAMSLWQRLATTLSDLAELERQRGDLEAAYQALQGYRDARLAFLDLERSLNLAAREVDFRVRQQSLELELFERERAALELAERADRQRARLLLALGALALSIVAILTVWLSRELWQRRQYQRLSNRDGLTGLLNHSRFFDRAGALLNDCRNSGQPFVLLLADVDHFKRFNDEHGHPCGDQALVLLANCLKACFSDSRTLAGRVGGEEFAIALAGRSTDEAQALMERCRQQLWDRSLQALPSPLTLSIGMAIGDDKAGLTACYAAADQAMYRAKQAGRNRIQSED
ncbi:MAG: diguanylate cyclase domain-containing protein [Wenzhouxiangella sp.]